MYHRMNNSIINVPEPVNEPVLEYRPGSEERKLLKAALADLAGQKKDMPLVIGGKEIRTGQTENVVMPHDHSHGKPYMTDDNFY